MHAPSASRLMAVVVLAGLVLSGCTDPDDSPGKPETGDSPTTRTSSSASEPTPTPTTSTPEPTDDRPLVDRLLPTGQVPGLNAQWKWQDGDTGTPPDDPFGLCAKADLLSIGATDVVARTYFPPDDSDDNAAEQIAEFPDARTASLAWAVLKSWHDKCADKRAANPKLRVRPMISVPVETGTARWYLLSWAPAGEETGRFEAFGMVLRGTRIAVLRMDNSASDHDYPAGKEPMVGMVSAAASWVH
jgi:hypothetical protein